MNIIYILSTILIVGLHMLIYKKEEKANWLKYFALTISILLCYNIVICVILSFVKIKTTLITLIITNLVITAILSYKIFKDKKIQKYYLNKMDILAITGIITIVLLISIKQYGIPINIKNSTTDAATHYLAANEFYHYSLPLINENSDMLGIWNEDFLMPGAYINTGILFKIISPVIDETYFCKIYVLFDIAMWCLSGMLMYLLLSNNKKQKILPLIFAIIYMIGYPLHSLISGFSYLQIGLNIIITILLIMQLDVNKYYKYVLMFLVNFGLMFSYYYFAPVVFFALFIQILLEIKDKQVKLSINALKVLFTLIIPGLYGVMYFIIFQNIKYGINLFQEYGNAINIPGPIYDNLITTILIFLILGIYNIIKNIKNKKQDISSIMLIISIIFLIIAFVGMKLQKVSEYYYYKIYYMLWIYVIVEAFYALDILKQKTKIITYGGIGLYCLGIIIAIIFNKNIFFFDIYQENFNEIKEEYKVISNEELQLFQYYNNNINSDDNLDDSTHVYIGGIVRPRWAYAITKNPYIFIDVTWGEPFTDIKQFLNHEKQYCIIFKLENEKIYENIEEIENIKILFKNDAGVIIEKY